MKKIFGIFVLLILVTGCNASEIKPLKTWTLNEKLYSASFEDDNLAVLKKGEVVLIPLSKSESASRIYNINDDSIDRLLLKKGTIWLGGGRNQKGTLYSQTVSGGTSKIRFDEQNHAEVYAISLIEKKNNLITAHANGEITLWDLNSLEKKNSFGNYASEIFSLAISADESKLYSGDGIGSIDSWDIKSGKKLKTYKIPHNGVFVLKTGPQKVISGGSNGILYLFDDDLSVQKEINFNGNAILSCDIHLDTGRIFCGLTDGYVAVTNPNGSDKKTIKLHEADVIYVTFLEKKNQIITVSSDGFIKLWKVNDI